MSDMFVNHIVGFPTRRLICSSVTNFVFCSKKGGLSLRRLISYDSETQTHFEKLFLDMNVIH